MQRWEKAWRQEEFKKRTLMNNRNCFPYELKATLKKINVNLIANFDLLVIASLVYNHLGRFC